LRSPVAFNLASPMLIYRLDPRLGLVVWLFTGKVNTDDDFARYVASFALADEASLQGPQPGIAILVVDEGNPMPNAKWRKNMAEASASLKSHPIFFLASASPLVRGVATAVNWMRPPPYELVTTSTFKEAVAIAEKRRGVPLPALSELYDEVRAEVPKAV
jgi:hypothetical protein